MRRTKKIRIILLSIILLGISMPLLSQTKGVKVTRKDDRLTTRILFILDCSNSMYGMWQSNTKIKIAQNLLSNMVDTLSDRRGVEMALRAYGHTKDYPPQDCDDTRLEVSFSANNSEQIKSKLKALIPKGTTPIAATLERCVDDFPKADNCRNIIILITDGTDECSGDVCAASKQLQKQGAFLKPFIIGIGKGMRETFQCAGVYYEATNEIEFSKALNDVVRLALDDTSIQVNILDAYMEASETNVPMTFYDSQSKKLRYTFIHTFNNKGLSDT
ncbi:MAG: VWA domain-containing protein, partial [Bacteroidales bacterium]|nr:VWA domain-containing protein [Bacteroidales bacterium]